MIVAGAVLPLLQPRVKQHVRSNLAQVYNGCAHWHSTGGHGQQQPLHLLQTLQTLTGQHRQRNGMTWQAHRWRIESDQKFLTCSM